MLGSVRSPRLGYGSGMASRKKSVPAESMMGGIPEPQSLDRIQACRSLLDRSQRNCGLNKCRVSRQNLQKQIAAFQYFPLKVPAAFLRARVVRAIKAGRPTRAAGIELQVRTGQNRRHQPVASRYILIRQRQTGIGFHNEVAGCQGLSVRKHPVRHEQGCFEVAERETACTHGMDFHGDVVLFEPDVVTFVRPGQHAVIDLTRRFPPRR